MNKKAVLGIMLALIIPLACYFVIKGLSGDAVHMPRRIFHDRVELKVEGGKEYADTVWHQVGDFQLKNQLGQSVSWKELEGKIVVASFFFTRCPSICPKMTQNMKKLQDAIKSSEKVGNREADFIHFLSFSIDPERDSVPELKKYADRFQINPYNWWLLTGDKKQIYDLALNEMRLGIVDGKNANEEFYHPDFFMLIDRNRNIRARVDEFGNPKLYHGLDSNDLKYLASDIVLLKLEKDKNRPFFLAGKLEIIAVAFIAAILGVVLLFHFLKKKENTHESELVKE